MKRTLLALLLLGCGPCHEIKPGDIQTERAVVIQMAYIPDSHGTGVGISSRGSLTTVSTSAPEVWAVVLRCSLHNRTFSLRDKNLYDRLSQGMAVTLEFIECDGDYQTLAVRTEP